VSAEDARTLSKRVLLAAVEASSMGPEALATATDVSRAQARRWLDTGDESCLQTDKLVRAAATAPSFFSAYLTGLEGLEGPPLVLAPTLDGQLRLAAASFGRVAEEVTAAQVGSPLVLESIPGMRRAIRAARERLAGLEQLVDRMARRETA